MCTCARVGQNENDNDNENEERERERKTTEKRSYGMDSTIVCTHVLTKE